jgi:ankyrin repeat protein
MGKFDDITTVLINAGADANIQSKDGQTALIVAVGADEEGTVEVLLKAGANPDIADHMGMSARKYASLFRKTVLMDLFNTYAPVKAG